MLRTAMLSFWHLHARDYARQADESQLVDLRYAWDDDLARGREEATKLGLKLVTDLDELLARRDLDAVIVQTPTTAHPDVIRRAVRAGKHVFSDKVLALTGQEAHELVAAADGAGVTLFVGLPYLYYDFVDAITTELERGSLGRVVSCRISNGHGMALDGVLPPGFFLREEAGGGALVDLCVGEYLAPHFFGMPSYVSATLASILGSRVENSAAAVLEYENGLIVTVEAAVVTPGASASTIEVHGSEGSIVFRADSQPGNRGAPRDYSLTMRRRTDESFTELPLGRPSPSSLEQWATHVAAGTRATLNNQRAIQLSELIEAAYLSASTRSRVQVPTHLA